MPLYEFYCGVCDKTYEWLLTRAARAAIDNNTVTAGCPECGGKLVDRVSRPASFPVGKYGKGGGL